MRLKADSTTLFDDDPGWLVGLRPGVGVASDGAFANLGLAVGKLTRHHFYLGGVLTGRADRRPWVRMGLRTGVLYQRRRLNFAIGTNLGLLYDLRTREVGVVPQFWAELRVRLSFRHFINVFGELDGRLRQLGFRRASTTPTVGVGWSVRF